MRQACRLTAMVEVNEGSYAVMVDTEEEHEREEVDIDELVRRLEAQEEHVRQAKAGEGAGDPGVPANKVLGSMTPLRRLTEYKNKKGDVSSVLALDDMTGMKMEARKVKEAHQARMESHRHSVDRHQQRG